MLLSWKQGYLLAKADSGIWNYCCEDFTIPRFANVWYSSMWPRRSIWHLATYTLEKRLVALQYYIAFPFILLFSRWPTVQLVLWIRTTIYYLEIFHSVCMPAAIHWPRLSFQKVSQIRVCTTWFYFIKVYINQERATSGLTCLRDINYYWS